MVNEKTISSASKLFWGRTAELPVVHTRRGARFCSRAIAAMSFCQFGFWPIGEIDFDPVYLILLLAPIIMGSIAFGP